LNLREVQRSFKSAALRSDSLSSLRFNATATNLTGSGGPEHDHHPQRYCRLCSKRLSTESVFENSPRTPHRTTSNTKHSKHPLPQGLSIAGNGTSIDINEKSKSFAKPIELGTLLPLLNTAAHRRQYNPSNAYRSSANGRIQNGDVPANQKTSTQRLLSTSSDFENGFEEEDKCGVSFRGSGGGGSSEHGVARVSGSPVRTGSDVNSVQVTAHCLNMGTIERTYL